MGTGWNDLSGKGKNFDLYNGPYSNNGESVVFDGSDDYALLSSSLYNPSTFRDESVFIWWYPTKAGQIVSELGQYGINTGWHDSNIEISASGVISFSIWSLEGLANRVNSSPQQFNKWYYLGFTYSGTTLTAYVNGDSIGTTTLTRQTASVLFYTIAGQDSTNMGTGTGTGTGTAEYGGGKCFSFVQYNRALTLNEIQQNYNVHCSRFGLPTVGTVPACTCAAGYSGTVAAGATTSALMGCKACPGGSYKSTPTNGESCTNVASCTATAGYVGSPGFCTCAAGYSGTVASGASTSTLTGCTICPGGSYNPNSGNNVICIPVTCAATAGYVGSPGACSCAAGYYGTVVSGATTPTLSGCKPCAGSIYDVYILIIIIIF